MKTQSSPLSRSLSIEEAQARFERLYPSITSFRWCLRVKRERLLKFNALMLVNGRVRIDPEAFEQAVLEDGLASVREAA